MRMYCSRAPFCEKLVIQECVNRPRKKDRCTPCRLIPKEGETPTNTVDVHHRRGQRNNYCRELLLVLIVQSIQNSPKMRHEKRLDELLLSPRQLIVLFRHP